jgi:hypothetical protein
MYAMAKLNMARALMAAVSRQLAAFFATFPH